MSMVFNRARDIALHISGLLEKITQANGYETDIGLKVFRGKLKIDDDIPPCVAVMEADEVLGGTQGPTSQQVTQHYAIVGYARCDPDYPNDTAHQMISDIKRALFRLPDDATRHEQVSGTRRFGGRVKAVQYQGRSIGPRADGRAIVFVNVHISVTYVEQLDVA